MYGVARADDAKCVELQVADDAKCMELQGAVDDAKCMELQWQTMPNVGSCKGQ